MTSPPVAVPARYADSGEPCVVTASAGPPATFAVERRLVFRLGPDHCEDGGRLIRADVPGAFGRF